MAIREGTFRVTRDVDLTEDEVRQRARQSAEGALAMEAQRERSEAEAEAWKERKKELANQEKTLLADLLRVAKAVRDRREQREVDAKESIETGNVVVVRLVSTGEAISTRPATTPELRELDRAREEAEEQMNAAAKAELEAQLPERIRTAIATLCVKGRTEEALVKAIAKETKATFEQVRGEVVAAIECGHLAEQAGKLHWIGPKAPTPTKDDGIVPDDYQPAATH